MVEKFVFCAQISWEQCLHMLLLKLHYKMLSRFFFQMRVNFEFFHTDWSYLEKWPLLRITRQKWNPFLSFGPAKVIFWHIFPENPSQITRNFVRTFLYSMASISTTGTIMSADFFVKRFSREGQFLTEFALAIFFFCRQ